MAEETTENTSINDVLDQFFNQGKNLEDINTEAKVINTDTAPAGDTNTDANKNITPPEETWFSKRGFQSEAEADAYFEASKKPKQPDYKHPLSSKLDAFATISGKTDMETFSFYENTEIKDEMTMEDRLSLLVRKHKMDNPALSKFSNEELVAAYKTRYMLDMDPEHASMEEKIAAADKEAELIQSSDKIITDIKEMREKIANGGVTEKDKQEYAAKLESNKAKWAEESKKYVENYKIDAYDFKAGADGKDEALETILKSYTFGQDVKDTYETTFDAIVADMGYPEPNSDSAKQAHFLADSVVKNLFFNRFIKEAIAQGEAKANKEIVEERDNPSATKKVATTENAEKAISEAQAVKEAGLG